MAAAAIQKTIVPLLLMASAAGCAVGPGTPLVDAMKADRTPGYTNVQPPKGYGVPAYQLESHGLINPKERAETAAYLERISQY
ncbi:hypothetical protein E1180_21495 [Roseibium denhamense]|uniref:Uncharacterized protein n=1 Tax=Roseibium denhamense TaxID=76305 RepID=A0ABY1NR88_9HYPH|nr:hypothetical protein [Roseibium denhamense]MTI08079.1 hypothetical protein [Roseibium denhamense]SMP16116.1 hypothetical protein SAMN06265374_1670 [Roseibium denhamense]